MKTKTLYNFISILRLEAKHNKIMFKYPNSSSLVFKLLDLFLEEGLIQGYSTFAVKPRKKTLKPKRLRTGVTIFFRLHKGRYNVFRNIANISVPSWDRYASFYKLKSLIFKAPSGLFFLSTSRGIISSVTAYKLKIGGKLLFKVN